MRPRTAPAGARRLRTCAEFESYLTDFAEGRYPFLWVVGRPGVAKSESIKYALRGRKVYYRQGGQVTPAQFYADCYHHRGEPVVLDDAEHLLDNKVGRRLASALGESTPVKRLSYATAGRAPSGVPPTYSTTSSLCIIANRASAHEEIQSRAVTLSFEPTSREVHAAVAAWFWDQEIHDWIGRHLHDLAPLEARWYVTAYQDKEAKRDWRRLVLEARGVNPLVSAAQEAERDGAYVTREEKAARFVGLTAGARGASRATYFRLLRRLGEERLRAEVVPPVPLRHTQPPRKPSLLVEEAVEAAAAGGAEAEARPIDVPLREEFARPVGGGTPLPDAPRPMILDDTVPWERHDPPDEDEEEAAGEVGPDGGQRDVA